MQQLNQRVAVHVAPQYMRNIIAVGWTSDSSPQWRRRGGNAEGLAMTVCQEDPQWKSQLPTAA
jgi:hypothetical protein